MKRRKAEEEEQDSKPDSVAGLDGVADDGAAAGGAEGAAARVAVGLAVDVAVELVVHAAGEGLAAHGAREAVGVPVLAAVLAVVAHAVRDGRAAARARERAREAVRLLGAVRAPVDGRERGPEHAVARRAAEVPLVPHAPERGHLRARDDRLAALRAHRAPRGPARGAVVRAVQRVVLARRQRLLTRRALEVLGVVHVPRARHQLAPRHDRPPAPLAHPAARPHRPLARLHRLVQQRHLLAKVRLVPIPTPTHQCKRSSLIAIYCFCFCS